MKGIRRVIVSVLVVAIFLTTPALAVDFTDVTKDGRYGWAYDFIMEMAQKGVINGYPDKTFKPGDSLTYLEAMKLIAELRPLTAREKTEAASKYSDLVIELQVPTWATEALMTNLVHGVTTESELRNAAKMGLIKTGTDQKADRILISVSLARALGLDQVDKQFASLIYKDTDQISSRFRKHIAALVDVGILNPQGRDGKFEPNSPIKRSEVAKMIKLAYDYLERNPVDPSIQEEVFRGVIDNNTVLGETFTLVVKEGETKRSFIINNRTEVTLDGRKSSADQLMVGMPVEVYYDTVGSRALNVNVKTQIEEEGDFAIVVKEPGEGEQISLRLGQDGKGEIIELTIAPDAKLLNDGNSMAKTSLKANDRVHYKAEGKSLVYLNRIPKSSALTGTLMEIEHSKNAPSYITVRLSSGLSQKILVAEQAEIVRGAEVVRLDGLAVGDSVAVQMSYGVAVRIDATSSQETVYGSISAITQRFASNPDVTIDDGKTNLGPFTVADKAVIKIDGYNVSATELRLDQKGEFVIEGKTITGVYIDGTTMNKNFGNTSSQGSIIQ